MSTNNKAPTNSAMAMISLTPTQLHWHLGHIHTPATIQLVKEKLPGKENEFCEPCVKAKHTWNSFPKE
jgi:hypothetical protein